MKGATLNMSTFIKRLSIIFFIIVMIVSFVFLSRGYELPHYTNDELYKEQSWTLKMDGQLINKDAQIPMNWQADDITQITLSTTLTYKPNSNDLPCAFISLNHMYCQVFLDDKEIYSYTHSTTPHLTKTPGNIYAIVPLDNDCTGKELRIEIIPTMSTGLVYSLEDVSFGDFPTVIRQTFIHDLPRIILTVVILFCGCVLTIISLFMYTTKFSKQLWHIGIFAILFSIYNTSEGLFVIYMVSNPYFMHLINLFVFALLPIPLLCFYQERINHKLNKTYHIVLIMLIANVTVQPILHFFRLCDLRQMLPVTHLMYALTLILILFSIFSMKDKNRQHFLAIETITLAVGAIIDGLSFYFNFRIFSSNTTLLQVAVLIVLLMEGIYMLHGMKNAHEENLKNVFYKKLAYKDALTNLKNRVAFNDDINKITSGIHHFDKMICMSVDINGLKIVNDTMGHLSGDTLIKTTADFLQQYFSSFSSIYRTGGDEFFLFMYDIDESDLTAVLQKMDEEITAYNETAYIPVSFAFGYCKYDGKNIEDCLRIADSNMYKCKNEMRSDKYTSRSNPTDAIPSSQL